MKGKVSQAQTFSSVLKATSVQSRNATGHRPNSSTFDGFSPSTTKAMTLALNWPKNEYTAERWKKCNLSTMALMVINNTRTTAKRKREKLEEKNIRQSELQKK